ncbi:hypothetical protein EHM69_04130 [candidate division KSB1 bacterium]|nr:MAG: hypothetical protein EHM69_04130 [candidate division KSB1 bacterium]
MKKLLIIVCVLLAGIAPSAFGQTYDTLKIVTFNILNYPPSDTTAKNPLYRQILGAIDPDILVVQEMTSSSGVTQFANYILNAVHPGGYSYAPFNNGYDTDNAMFYRTSKVSFIGPQTVLSTALRDINGYRLRPAGVTADSLDIQIYSAHLKASSGYEEDREAEAQILRNHLNSLADGGFFIAAGDFNLYNSATEGAWTQLTGSMADNSGRLYDPLNSPGNWHDNASFAAIHTQSTRTTALGDGGSTGGMDDRFDFMLLSYNFPNAAGWDYISGSYTEYGNDGNHFDQSINDGTNGAVPQEIADALHAASDHLPVFLKVRRQVTGPPSLTLTAPNGSEVWYTGTSNNITWTSQNLNGTITIRLKRDYPSGTWDTLIAGTANDGLHAWTATTPATEYARIQIISDTQTSVRDSSDANFAIRIPTVTVLQPNGGDEWTIGQTDTIKWSTTGVTGNVRIELNRSYPSANWEILFGSAVNDGSEPWTPTAPSTLQARFRIYSVNNPAISDTSDGDFNIYPSAPPVIMHDPHGDVELGWVKFTARVTDDFPDVTAQMFYRKAAAVNFDSIEMASSGFPDEVCDSLNLGYGLYQYFIRALDVELQPTYTDTMEMAVSAFCVTHLSYDDGSAELFNWSEHDSFIWAVRFTPPQVPFTLCEAEFVVAGFHPDTAHSPVRLRVYSADGSDGMPGTLLREVVRGSVGNVIGGLPSPGAYTSTVILHDSLTDPLQVTGDFYVALENPATFAEAFAMDTSSANAARSVMFDPCESQWFAENGVHEQSRNGNRMIRVRGWAGTPSGLTITASGNDAILRWQPNGAAYYKVFKYLNAFSPIEYVATTSDTTYTVSGAISAQIRTYYTIVASSAP